MSTETAIKLALADFHANWRDRFALSATAMGLWLRELAHFAPEEIEMAARLCITKSKWPPTVAEFIEQVGRVRQPGCWERSAENEWAMVYQWCCTPGDKPFALDALQKHALDSCGGSFHVRRGNYKATRDQFIAAFEYAVEQAKRVVTEPPEIRAYLDGRQAPPQLPARGETEDDGGVMTFEEARKQLGGMEELGKLLGKGE